MTDSTQISNRSPLIRKPGRTTAWVLTACALLFLSPEAPAAPPLREPTGTATQTLRLNLQNATLDQLAQAIREQARVNLLLAEELRATRIPDIQLAHVTPAEALRAVEKIVPGISLEVLPGPSGPGDPGTVFHLLPARKNPPAACQVLGTGDRFAEKKAFQEFLHRATDAVAQACATRSKADPARPLAAPRIDPHPQTQLLFVSGAAEAVELATQVLVALGCAPPAHGPAHGPPTAWPHTGPLSLGSAPLPPAESHPDSKPARPGISIPPLPVLPVLPVLPGSPRNSPSARPKDTANATPAQGSPTERLSQIQAAHADSTRRLRILEENSRALPARKVPAPTAPTAPGAPSRNPTPDR